MAGLGKLTPAISAGMHDELILKFNTLFTPFIVKELQSRLSIQQSINPDVFRQFVGASEVIIAVLLFTPVKPLAGK
jgi:hypothetical protein